MNMHDVTYFIWFLFYSAFILFYYFFIFYLIKLYILFSFTLTVSTIYMQASISFSFEILRVFVCRQIFWTEWLRNDKQTPRIGRALSDGTNKSYIRTQQLGWPNGLVIELFQRRLWWCDALFDRYIIST